MIKIWEPRYRDKKVLVACHRVPYGFGAEVEITKGAYKGKYKITSTDLERSAIETLAVKRGGTIRVRAVPIDYLRRIEP